MCTANKMVVHSPSPNSTRGLIVTKRWQSYGKKSEEKN